MGYMRHHAVLVSGSYGDHVEAAHRAAVNIYSAHDLGGLVSPIIDGAINGVRSFLVVPDGSKEGWETSDASDDARAALVGWLADQAYDDGSSPLAWAEVVYGDEAGLDRVCRTNANPDAEVPA